MNKRKEMGNSFCRHHSKGLTKRDTSKLNVLYSISGLPFYKYWRFTYFLVTNAVCLFSLSLNFTFSNSNMKNWKLQAQARTTSLWQQVHFSTVQSDILSLTISIPYLAAFLNKLSRTAWHDLISNIIIAAAPGSSQELSSYVFEISYLCNSGEKKMLYVAVRLLTSSSKWAHITPISYSSHWLPVDFENAFSVLIYRALNWLGPDHLSQHLIKHTTARSLQSQDQNLLVLPTRLKTSRGRAFQSVTPRVYHSSYV